MQKSYYFPTTHKVSSSVQTHTAIVETMTEKTFPCEAHILLATETVIYTILRL